MCVDEFGFFIVKLGCSLGIGWCGYCNYIWVGVNWYINLLGWNGYFVYVYCVGNC